MNTKLYLITFTDIFSRYTKLYLLKEITAKECAKWLLKFIVDAKETPKTLISDQGKQFVSSLFKNICQAKGIRHLLTTAYTPTSNSVSERINSTINYVLRICKNFKSIHEAVRVAENNLNLVYNTSIKTS